MFFWALLFFIVFGVVGIAGIPGRAAMIAPLLGASGLSLELIEWK